MKLQRLLPIIIVLALFTATPAFAGNLDTYFDNQESSITIDEGEQATYYIDYIPNSWAEEIDVNVTLYDETIDFENKGSIYKETGIDVTDGFYFSPPLDVTQDDYDLPGEYLLDVQITQYNDDGTTSITSQQLDLNVSGERTLNADFEYTPNEPTEDDTITFTSTSEADNDITSYEWAVDGEQFGTGQEVQEQFEPGTYDITLTITDEAGNQDSETKQVSVTALEGPTANFTFDPIQPDVDEDVTFSSTSVPGDADIVSYEWNIDGDTFTGEDVLTAFDTSGTKQATLTVEDSRGETDSITKDVHVQELVGPTANFTFEPINPDVNEDVTFSSTSEEGDSPITSYEWDIDGETLNGESVTKAFDTSGTKQVTLTVEDQNGLTSTITKDVHVQELTGPSANFTFEPTNPDVNEDVTFTSTSTEGDSPIVSYEWSINGESLNGEPVTTSFQTPGTKQATLTVTDENGLTSSITKDVNVQALEGPMANFTFDLDDPTVNEDVTFSSTSMPGDNPINQYEWEIDGETFTGEEVTTVFEEAGTYSVTLTVTDTEGLKDSQTREITVTSLEGPTANFTFDPDDPDVDEQVTFTSTSTEGDGTITSYEWSIDGEQVGTGSTLENTFTSPGTYHVTLLVTDSNGLSDDITRTVTVQALEGPTADFTFDPEQPNVDQDVTFTSTSQEGDSPITDYVWEIDGEDVSTEEEFTTSFDNPGTYDITLTVTDQNDLSDDITKDIHVSEDEEEDQLILDELAANTNVVQGHEQHISGHVSDQDQNDVENATITFSYVETDEILGSCTTNFKGYCHINPTINKEPGFYEVTAIAEKTGYQPDLSEELRTIFQVWEQRYTIQNLETFEDEFVTESDEFYRGEPVYSSFDIIDDFTGEEITPPTDLITDVKLRVNNVGEGDFDPYDVLENGEELQNVDDEGNFRYVLDSIPLTDDFLGEGKVFAFAFNFTDGTAGQASTNVTIFNNPVTFNQPKPVELSSKDTRTVDFKQYLSDVETPNEEITLRFGQAPFTINNDGKNTITLQTTNTVPGTYEVDVEADDNDGSTQTQTWMITVEQQDFEGPSANFTFEPTNPDVNQDVTFTSTSTEGDSPIVSYEWSINGESFSGESVTTSFETPGTKQATLTVTDENDLQDTITKTVTVNQPRQKPNADFTFTPQNPNVDEEVTFTSNSTDPQGTIETEEWFIGDEKVGEGRTITNTFTSPDNYTVRLLVTNDAGLQDQRIQTIEVTQEDIGQINTDFTYEPTQPKVGEEVLFTEAVTTTGVDVEEFVWRVDGEIIAENVTNFTYVFDESKDYEVSLTAMTETLSDTETKTIPVQDREGPNAVLSIPSETIEGQEEILDASKSTPNITEYRYTVRRGQKSLDNFVTSDPKEPYTFEHTGRITVDLTVLDEHNRTDSTAESIYVANEYRDDIPGGDKSGVRVTNTRVGGEGLNIIGGGETVRVSTSVDNYFERDVENIEISFEIPELAYQREGQSFDLDEGEGTDRTLTFTFDPYYYQPGEYMATVTVSNTDIIREKEIPIIIN